MIFSKKQFLSTITLLFLVVLTFTNGQDGHQNPQSNSDSNNDTQILEEGSNSTGRKGSSDDYDWHNNDDYTSDDNTNGTDHSSDDSEIVPSQPEDGKVNATDSSNSSSADLINNGTLIEQGSAENITTPGESIPSSTQSSSSTVPEGNESQSPQTSSSTEGTPSSGVSLSSSTSEGESSSTPTTDNGNTTSTEKVPPVPISTQDLGGNLTTTSIPERNGNESRTSGFTTWSVVVVSVLISFAAIFTILYFIRGELIRRRKADQRRLLRGSVSSEGYFYGDGEGNTGGKFEL